VYGRKHLPMADKNQETIYMRRNVYNVWLYFVNSEHCAAERGWTKYTREANKMAALANLLAHTDGDFSWRENHRNALRKHHIRNSKPWHTLSVEQQKSHVMRRALTWLHGADYDAPPRL